MVRGKITVTPSIEIDDADIEETFVRASGPGGQNVNKVATAVQLRFDAANAAGLTDAVRRRLARLAGRRMTRDGIVVIEARRFRTRERNRADALARLVALIGHAARQPRRRRPGRVPGTSKARRLEAKHRRAAVKRTRGSISDADLE